MHNKKRLDINAVLGEVEKPVTSFEEADKKESGEQQKKNKGGRPMIAKTPSNIPIRFVIDQELEDWLESMTGRKEKTPSAVVKKILLNYYEMHKKQ
jgi:hypothetical protein